MWKGRITLVGADRCWQALANGLFYLFSSTHVGSPASTSIFGLATWHDYHYYYGHVMWDIETFVVPVLTLLQPHTAESILDYRTRTLPNATTKRALAGPKRTTISLGECAVGTGKSAPLPGSASWHEDHVSLDVARAFAFHSYVTASLFLLRFGLPLDLAFLIVAAVAIVISLILLRSGVGALKPSRLVPAKSISQISSLFGGL